MDNLVEFEVTTNVSSACHDTNELIIGPRPTATKPSFVTYIRAHWFDVYFTDVFSATFRYCRGTYAGYSVQHVLVRSHLLTSLNSRRY